MSLASERIEPSSDPEPNPLPRRGERVVEIDDDGLAPIIRRGDVVTVVPLDGNPLKRGDILLFRKRDQVFARRYDGREGTHVRLCDCVGYDDVVPVSEILGRVVRCTREGQEHPLGTQGGFATQLRQVLARFRLR